LSASKTTDEKKIPAKKTGDFDFENVIIGGQAGWRREKKGLNENWEKELTNRK